MVMVARKPLVYGVLPALVVGFLAMAGLAVYGLLAASQIVFQAAVVLLAVLTIVAGFSVLWLAFTDPVP